MNLDKLQEQGLRFCKELETEDRLVRIGIKKTLESAKIYKKYKSLFDNKTLKQIEILIKGLEDPDKLEIAKRIYFFLASCAIGQKLASDSDKLTTFYSNSQVKLDGKFVSYFELAPLMSKETDFNRRELIDNLSLKVASKAKTKELELLNAEIKLLKTMGWKGYLDFASQSKNVNYARLEVTVKKILKGTDALWNKTMTEVSPKFLGKPFKKLKACHLSYLRSLSMFDTYYPASKVVPVFKRYAGDMGLGDLLVNIHIDDADRPRKNPRAVCYWPDPPQEVHLVIKPMGGEQDYEAVLHEGGHALHAAAEDPNNPWVFRFLSRSNALTEMYAFVMENLVFEPLWLSKYLGVPSSFGKKIQWQATFVNLMLLRRYLGKFLYEYKMFSGNNIAKGPNLYAKTLEQTTGFVHSPEKYLNDMDGSLYSADYLRAWIGAAQFKDYLSRRFGQKWFFNPKTGAFLRELWKEGVKYDLEAIIEKIGCKPWDTTLLVSGYDRVLK